MSSRGPLVTLRGRIVGLGGGTAAIEIELPAGGRLVAHGVTREAVRAIGPHLFRDVAIEISLDPAAAPESTDPKPQLPGNETVPSFFPKGRPR